MYHIKKDKRMIQSADKLLAAMTNCLKTRPLNSISVTDLQRESGVGRSTFYRLFDTPIDILSYGCNEFAAKLRATFQKQSTHLRQSREDFLKFALAGWMEASDLLEAILKCKRPDILESAIRANTTAEDMPEHIKDLTQEERLYVETVAAAAITGIIFVWVRGGKKETPEQLLSLFERVM